MARILIIEDEASIRANLKRFLSLEGHVVEEAANGQEGVARVEEILPDLILCDVMMPELDGHGVLAYVRSRPHLAAIPLVFLSASVAREEVAMGMQGGAEAYVAKPFNVSSLLAVVDGVLRQGGST